MMEWGVALNLVESVETTIATSIRLEQGGIDSLWITDFPAVRAAAPLAGAVAESTRRCRIGVGLLSPDVYGADMIVRQLQTLQQNFGERFDILIGPGDRLALQRIGIVQGSGPEIARRTKEAAVDIRLKLRESGFAGRVFLGAQGPKMIAASTRMDGVLLNYSDAAMIKWAIGQLKEIPGGFIVGIFPPTWLDENPDFGETEAIRRAASMVAIGLAKLPQDEFEIRDELDAGLRKVSETGRIGEDVMMSIGNSTLCRFALCTDGAALNSYLKRLEKLGVGLVVFGPPLCTSSEGLNILIDAKNTSLSQ